MAKESQSPGGHSENFHVVIISGKIISLSSICLAHLSHSVALGIILFRDNKMLFSKYGKISKLGNGDTDIGTSLKNRIDHKHCPRIT